MLTAGLWMAVALGVGGYLLSGAIRDYAEGNLDQRLVATLDSLVGASTMAPDGGVMLSRKPADQRYLEPYSGWYWQISSPDRVFVRSRSLWDQQLDVDFNHSDPITDSFETFGPDNQLLRVVERDIYLPDSDQAFRYLVAGDTSEITAQMNDFNRLLVGSLGGLGLGLLAAMMLQVTFGLHPLSKIRTVLSDIRSGRARRLERDFPPEILPLVDEVNAVLDHNDTLVARARTHVGNLAHALKTPLSVMSVDNEKQELGEYSRRVSNQLGFMRQHVEHYLARARAMGRVRVPGARAEIKVMVSRLVRALTRLYEERGVTFDQQVPPLLAFWGDEEDLAEILGNILDNAAKWAKSIIRIGAGLIEENGAEYVIITIDDDGPGVSREKRAALFERGAKLDRTKPGSGLGLAIVGDIAEICGGSVDLTRSELGGLSVRVKLPAVPGTDNPADG
jgi:signal transduction histidine kinase